MKSTFCGPLAIASTALILPAQFAFAQDRVATDSPAGVEFRGETEILNQETIETGPGFQWEGEIEIGTEQVFDSTDPDNEIRDTYAIISFGGSYKFGNGIEVFSVLTAESLTDPVESRSFEDMGVYVEELGLSFPIGDSTTVSIGKVHPVFGSGWDDTAGFFGAALSEDYELIEQIGVLADVEIIEGGTLSFGVFYADDTALSKSIGFKREQNTVEDGGAGNTGQLDNVAVQWRQEVGDTFYQVGARYLSAGEGDVNDETGILASIGHTLNDSFYVFAEAASFKNFGGGEDDATYLTLNGSYYVGDWAFSATLGNRDLDEGGNTDLASIAAEYTFDNGMTLGGALAYVDEAGTKNRILGVNLIIPLGG